MGSALLISTYEMGRQPFGLASAAALVDVAFGALLGTLYAAGAAPVLEDWDLLKPAHAWLKLSTTTASYLAASAAFVASAGLVASPAGLVQAARPTASSVKATAWVHFMVIELLDGRGRARAAGKFRQ